VATALEWLATLSAGLFAGAALYVSLVEHPARVGLGPRAAVDEFRPSYRRGAALQAPLGVLGGAAGIARWATGGCAAWLVGGLALGALVPFTLVLIVPTNKRLLDPTLDAASSEALTSSVPSRATSARGGPTSAGDPGSTAQVCKIESTAASKSSSSQ